MFLICLKYLLIYLFIWYFWFTIYKITTSFFFEKELKINFINFKMI
jgi:hypothetical protein